MIKTKIDSLKNLDMYNIWVWPESHVMNVRFMIWQELIHE
jgi:hypothetical protein